MIAWQRAYLATCAVSTASRRPVPHLHRQILVGLLMQHGGGMAGATLALLAWNLLSWGPEGALLRHAQRRSPALAAERPPPAAKQEAAAAAADSTGGGGGLERLTQLLQCQLRAWALYARQPAAAAALALALLYLTVMSWGTLMTGGVAGVASLGPACKPCCLTDPLLPRCLLMMCASPPGAAAYLKALGLPETELAIYRG